MSAKLFASNATEKVMAEEKVERLREGVIKYTKPPENKTPPSQRETSEKK